ncbi:hypothetical protein WBG99_18175 [Streptomyces sp. TG1A-60]|uniref:hypothetical protein n=1 Tax=Streptomyces sp. TG1A-60 TaxID=3129111 RepID=UPI0030CFB920
MRVGYGARASGRDHRQEVRHHPQIACPRGRSRRGARGFSRFVSDAVEHALALTETREIVEVFEDEHGSFTPEEIEGARRTWHGE